MHLEIECVSAVANHSVFSEYHQELFRKYNMFAIDSSYGTENADPMQVGDRLLYYYDKNMNREVYDNELERYLVSDFFGLQPTKVSVDEYLLLTDRKGEMFRRQATDIVKEDLGVGIVEQVIEWLQVVQENQMTERNIHEEKEELERQLMSRDGEEIEVIEDNQRLGFQILRIVNPTGGLEEIRKKGILLLVLQPSEKISEKKIKEKNLVVNRIQSGNGLAGSLKAPNASAVEKLTEKIWFNEYLIRYMTHYGVGENDEVLDYQLEYILAGFQKDTDNLLAVTELLLGIREVANTIYLFSDEEKYEEVKTLVSALATVLMVPELADILTPIVIMGWAFAESVYDVYSLMHGKRIPLMKDKSSWRMGLSGAMEGDFTKPSEEENAEEDGNGLCYEDYFRILFCMVDKHIITERAMNLVEANLRLTPGNEHFRLDGCVVGMQTTVGVESSRGQDFWITRKRYY